ncbi:MAG: ABC transporter substrate-binding protein [Bacillota bacterium]
MDYISLVYNDKYNGGEAPYINSLFLRADYEYADLDFAETNDVSTILDYRSILNQYEHDANSIFYRYFVFNIDKGGELDPVLSDIRVRQALMHAIDRESIVKNVYYGIGYVNNTAAVQEYDNPIESDYSYDPELALALLEEAEYDFDRPVTLLYYYSDATSIKFMDEVGKYLEEIGLTVEIIKGDLYADETDAYDMGLKGLPVFSIEDWYNEYLSSTKLHTDVYGGQPMFDDHIIDLKQATSAEERNEILAELQALEYELLYKTPLFIMGHKVYVSSDVVLPENVKFGDSKYKYDLDLENWKIDS